MFVFREIPAGREPQGCVSLPVSPTGVWLGGCGQENRLGAGGLLQQGNVGKQGDPRVL